MLLSGVNRSAGLRSSRAQRGVQQQPLAPVTAQAILVPTKQSNVAAMVSALQSAAAGAGSSVQCLVQAPAQVRARPQTLPCMTHTCVADGALITHHMMFILR